MGSITSRPDKQGKLSYRAAIRINRKGMPSFSESKTFSTYTSANKWLKHRELEIKENPEILLGKEKIDNLTLKDAIDRYLEKLGDKFGRTKHSTLRLIQKFPIARHIITNINSVHLEEHVSMREKGNLNLGLEPISASTLQHELLHIRGVLSYANVMLDAKVDLQKFDNICAKFRHFRRISSSEKRDRLPNTKELIELTKYFKNKWDGNYLNDRSTKYPMHLILWLAIFSCRRQAELTRLYLSNFDQHNLVWKVEDLKSPNGSKGNNKSFKVSPECKIFIDLLLKPSIRQRMLKLGYDENLLLPLNPKCIGKEFTEACKVLGIQNLRFHDLRHEGCTRLAEQNFAIPQIQKISLHRSWSSLERYVSLNTRSDVLKLKDIKYLIDVDKD